MANQKWRNELELVINENLKELINETKEYDHAIKKAKDKGKAQIWVAMALLNSKLNALSLENKSKINPKKLSKDELDKILDTLEKL